MAIVGRHRSSTMSLNLSNVYGRVHMYTCASLPFPPILLVLGCVMNIRFCFNMGIKNSSHFCTHDRKLFAYLIFLEKTVMLLQIIITLTSLHKHYTTSRDSA